MLNLKLFMKLVRQLLHITAALIGSNEEKHTKSSYTVTLIEKLQINSYLRNQPRYSCIALYCAWTRDKFCSGSTKIIVWGLDHPPPVDSLFRLTLGLAFVLYQEGTGRSGHSVVVTQRTRVRAYVWLQLTPYTTTIGLNKAKVLLQTLLNCSSFRCVLRKL